MGRIKTRVFEIVSSAKEDDKTSLWFDMLIIFLILISVGELILVTVPPGMLFRHFWLFATIEIVTAVAFTIEYLLRMWSCTVDDHYKKPIIGRIRYALTPLVPHRPHIHPALLYSLPDPPRRQCHLPADTQGISLL
ncbi:ion transporter [Methanogenium cariaci]|uniref:ion transporter n=1 Tax=Methanogenium cariaci TaxID=2197 RepID=UPI000783BEE2|nr:ion transporter [Methanogenium cariaci]